MSALADAAEHYVMLRRAVGFKLVDADRVLGDYACFAEAHGTQRVTAALALEWAQLGSSPSRCSHRLQVLGRFAVWFQAFDPDSELPPPATVSAYRRRRNPYLYSPTEITALMDAARGLEPRLWAATTETVIGVLAATGMRVGEVLRLNRSDVGWDEATVTVWHTKFDKSRLVPLSASTMAALVAYDRLRRDTRTVRSSPALFVAARGGRLDYPRFRATFVGLLDAAGIATPGDRRQPRIHDYADLRVMPTRVGNSFHAAANLLALSA